MMTDKKTPIAPDQSGGQSSGRSLAEIAAVLMNVPGTARGPVVNNGSKVEEIDRQTRPAETSSPAVMTVPPHVIPDAIAAALAHYDSALPPPPDSAVIGTALVQVNDALRELRPPSAADTVSTALSRQVNDVPGELSAPPLPGATASAQLVSNVQRKLPRAPTLAAGAVALVQPCTAPATDAVQPRPIATAPMVVTPPEVNAFRRHDAARLLAIAVLAITVVTTLFAILYETMRQQDRVSQSINLPRDLR
jgi:hypothetical protein